MNQPTQFNSRKRRASRIFSYTEKDLEGIVMQHFLLNNDENLPEHFAADIKFVTSSNNRVRAKSRVNVYVR